MKGLNKVILIGHLGQDPEARETATGSMVTTLSVATTDMKKMQATGEMVKETEWHRVVCFSHTAKFVKDYVKKGDLVYVEGRLKVRKYNDKQGVEKTIAEILANDIQKLSKSTEGQQGPAGPRTESPQHRPAGARVDRRQPAGYDPLVDDDVPF